QRLGNLPIRCLSRYARFHPHRARALMKDVDKKSAFVLVVDDDADIRETIAGVLEDEGYGVAGAKNGQEALTWLRAPGSPRPQLILLELMMPVMSGPEFRAAQEADPSLHAIPVVIVSASQDAQK